MMFSIDLYEIGCKFADFTIGFNPKPKFPYFCNFF